MPTVATWVTSMTLDGLTELLPLCAAVQKEGLGLPHVTTEAVEQADVAPSLVCIAAKALPLENV